MLKVSGRLKDEADVVLFNLWLVMRRCFSRASSCSGDTTVPAAVRMYCPDAEGSGITALSTVIDRLFPGMF